MPDRLDILVGVTHDRTLGERSMLAPRTSRQSKLDSFNVGRHQDFDVTDIFRIADTRDGEGEVGSEFTTRIVVIGKIGHRVLQVHPYCLQRSLAQNLVQLWILIASAFPEFYKDRELVEREFWGESGKGAV